MPNKNKEEATEEFAGDPTTASPARSVLDLAAEEIEEVVGFALLEEAEYELILISLSARFSKASGYKNPVLLAQMQPQVDDPDLVVGWVSDNLNLPYQGCSKEARRFFTNRLAAFRLAFVIDNNEFQEVIGAAFQELAETGADEISIEDYNDTHGQAILEIKETDGYEPRNTVKTYLVG